jgi:Mn2+/Fe2+ NRAMP family transporter
VFGLSTGDEKAKRFWTVVFSALFPLICLIVYVFVRAPKQMVLASGLMQAIMLPMLGAAGLYFRYRRCDSRVRPGFVWDVCLWVSGAGLLLAGGWAFYDKLSQVLWAL